MAYDPAMGDMVLFGGDGNSGYMGDTWTFNGKTWTQLSLATSPSARGWAPMAYDPATGDMVLFGGYDGSFNLVDTWTFNGKTWTQLSPAISPSTRDGASMAYDPAMGDMVLFGGYDSSYLSDTWTYTQIVGVAKATSKTALRLSAAKVTYGDEQVEHLSVTVSPQYSGSTPTGTVTIKATTTTLCVIKLRSGKGSCALSAKRLKAGTYGLVASYGGSTDFDASASAKQPLMVTTTTKPSKTALCVGSPQKCMLVFSAPDLWDLSALTVGSVLLNIACPDPGVCDQPAGDQLDAVEVVMSVGSSGMARPCLEVGNFALVLSDGKQAPNDSITADNSVEYALCGLGFEGPNASFVAVVFFDVPSGSTWTSVNFTYYSSEGNSQVYVFHK
jgi:hypothetical protein